ncbi:MAG: IPT/TIG domain-containing protein, partial [Candidatus Acidiferrales bacterium]
MFIPVITSTTPNSVSAGGPSFAVLITGSGFASAVVLVGGTPVTVTSITSNTVGAMIPAGMIATPGTLTVVVVNVLPSGNVTSNSSVITVTSSSELPVLAINKTHTGNFTQGQTGATFQVTVSNTGTGDTEGQVTVTEVPPTGLTVTAMAGTGWTCVTTCTRSDTLAGGASYTPITVTVNVATNAPSSLTNQVEVSGGGSAPATGSDTVTIGTAGTPMLSIGAMTNSATFPPGGTGIYTITVSNTGDAATTGTITVMATLDSSLTPGSMGISGIGWTCNNTNLSCTINTS